MDYLPWILLVFWILIEIIQFLYLKLLDTNDLSCSKSYFIRRVLEEVQLTYPSKRNFRLEIRYYEPKKIKGRYFFESDTLLIYVGDNTNLLDLVDTIIHEYIHHLQNQLNSSVRSRRLNLYSEEYFDHDWEIEARYVAKKFRKRVLKSIL